MAVRQDKIRIEVYGPAAERGTAPANESLADDAVLRLARLIGRQIAREQFERRQAKERRSERNQRTGEAP